MKKIFVVLIGILFTISAYSQDLMEHHEWLNNNTTFEFTQVINSQFPGTINSTGNFKLSQDVIKFKNQCVEITSISYNGVVWELKTEKNFYYEISIVSNEITQIKIKHKNYSITYK